MGNLAYDDIGLLNGLANNDRRAIQQIYNTYQPILTKWMVTRGGSENDAIDIFQESLVVLFEKAKDPAFCLTVKLSTYLFAIFKRIWFKKSKHYNDTIFIDPTPDEDTEGLTFTSNYEEDLAAHFEKEADFTKLTAALDELGGSCSDLLKAFYIQNKSMQDIATEFKYTNAENAKTQKYKCLTRLKKIFFSK